jgi:hypothetical protein
MIWIAAKERNKVTKAIKAKREIERNDPDLRLI